MAKKKSGQTGITGKVTFVRKYIDNNKHLYINGVEYNCPYPIVRYIYSALDESTAKDFLSKTVIDTPMTYVHVETPTGTWCKDIKGIYNESIPLVAILEALK